MINILVVDDEPISADGISIYLEEHGDSTWNIFTAYNGANALKFSQQRIDILLTDIMMPGMDGFTLQEQIRQRWPMVKTVFLTGNNQLDFAKKAIRTGSVIDYVLKMEDETVVLKAVRKAVAALEDHMRTQEALMRADQTLSKIRPLLQKDFLTSVLKGTAAASQFQDQRFTQLGLPFFADKPVLLLVGQINGCDEQMSDLSFCALDNVLEKFLWPIYRFCMISVAERRVAVFIQLASQRGTLDVQHTFSLLELVQQTFGKTMGSVTLVLNHMACSWAEVSQHYRAMLLTLEQNLSVSDDTLVLQSAQGLLPENMCSRELHAIRSALECRDYEKAASLCHSILPPHTPTGRITLYRQLLKLFSIAVDARPDASSIYSLSHVPLLQLSDNGWKQTQAEFSLLLKSLSGTVNSPSQRKEELVRQICTYVDAHLAEDLSLSQIAAITYHSPTYISKIFSEVKGFNYNRYVVNQRLSHAAELLLSTRLVLEDIVDRVGYSSASYFIHAFRSKYGMTPAEYRKKAEHFPKD